MGERCSEQCALIDAKASAFRSAARINREMAGAIGAEPGSSIWAALEACAEKMDEIAARLSPTPAIESEIPLVKEE